MTRMLTMAALGAMLAVLAATTGASAADAEIKFATVTGDTTPWCMTSGFMYDPNFGPKDVAGGVKYTSILLTPAQAVVALNNGDVNLNECVGVSGLTQAWVKGGRDIVAVVVSGAKPFYALVGGKKFKKLDDLKGGTVGSAGPQTTATQTAEMILKRGANMVQDRDYKFVSAGTASARFAALNAGRIDALSTYPPFLYRVADDGLPILGKEADYVPDYVVGVLAVNRTWAEKNRPTVVQMVKSVLRTGEWMRDPANKSAVIDRIAEAIHISGKGIGKAYASRMYDDFVTGKILAFDGYADEKKFTTAMDFMSERGFLDKKDYPALNEMVDYSYLNEARRELGMPPVKQLGKN